MKNGTFTGLGKAEGVSPAVGLRWHVRQWQQE